MRTESTSVSLSLALPLLDTCSRPYLEVLLHAAQELAINLAGLRVAEPLALGLAQPVLEDPAVLVGSLQLVAHLLKLTSVLLEEAVPHLVHLGPQLIYLVLAPGREGVGTQQVGQKHKCQQARGEPANTERGDRPSSLRGHRLSAAELIRRAATKQGSAAASPPGAGRQGSSHLPPPATSQPAAPGPSP